MSLLKLDEAAALLRVHRATLYRLLKNGKIPHVKVGNNYRLDRDVLTAWMKDGGTSNARKRKPK